MRLRYSPLSPFARKVLVAAHETGTFARLDLVPADVWSSGSDIAADNPLGKVPVLVAPEGPIIGSTLICQYLDELHDGPRLVPAGRGERWRVLSAHALADGIMDAAVAHVVERIRRPAGMVWAGWLERQESKIEGALGSLAGMPAETRAGLDLHTVTLGCALAYLDRRLPLLGWRDRHPGLAAWLDAFATRPAMDATRPPPG